MSCSLRDAAALEALGIPTALLVNDVFRPIADATAAVLGMPGDYVARHVVWLPHPTSTLTKAEAAALIDARIETIRGALLGTAPVVSSVERFGDGDLLATARAIVAGLAESLRADGAALTLEEYANGVLRGTVVAGGAECADGACLMPAPQLEKMIAALVGPRLPGLRRVELREELAPGGEG